MFKKRDEERVEEEILSMVEEGHEQGFIQEDEAEMISNILDLDDKIVRDIMTSRNKIFAVSKEDIISDIIRSVWRVVIPDIRFMVRILIISVGVASSEGYDENVS